jgi:hypothetical protein
MPSARELQRPHSDDAAMWLKIFTAICQTDGYRKPVESTDSIFRSFKRRFPNYAHASDELLDKDFDFKDEP